jgi:hypothetical protein
MGYGYADAANFFSTLPPCPRQLEPPPEDGPTRLTQSLQNSFLTVLTLEDLRPAYEEKLALFGALHARAFHYFRSYMDQLLRPTSWLEEDETVYSLETVMETYFSLHMPSGKDRSGYSVTQKLLKQSWPNATVLKDIYAYRKDVPRKLLLLLYVITENCVDRVYSEFDEGYIDAPIARRPLPSLLRFVDPSGKPSLTRFQVLQRQENRSLLQLQPLTGRTHQLRVHCAHMGFPILGDPQYGTPQSLELSTQLGLQSQLLCAKSLTFPHPVTGEEITVCTSQKADI